jgi:hypothetical protein
MDHQQRLRDLALERARLLNACVIDMDHVDRVEKAYAHLVLRVEQDRLVKTR